MCPLIRIPVQSPSLMLGMLFSPLSAHLGPGMHCTSPGCRAGHASFIPEEAQLQVCRALLLLPCSGKRGCSGHTPWAGNKGGLGFGSQHNWGFISMGEALITQVKVAEWPPSSSHSALCFCLPENKLPEVLVTTSS